MKLKDPDPNPAVVISVLATIGELAQVRTCLLLIHLCDLLHSVSNPTCRSAQVTTRKRQGPERVRKRVRVAVRRLAGAVDVRVGTGRVVGLVKEKKVRTKNVTAI